MSDRRRTADAAAPTGLVQALGVDVHPPLLERALTHRSYAYEHGGLPTNERLEFLGDSVLGLVVTDALFRRRPEMPEGQLAKLRHGTASLYGTGVRLAGEARDSADYASILEAAKTPPDAVKADIGGVVPPVVSPFVFSVRRDAQGLTMSGFFPDEKTHAALRAALDKDFLKETVTDVSAIGGGAPAGFADAALTGLEQLARIGSGEPAPLASESFAARSSRRECR